MCRFLDNKAVLIEKESQLVSFAKLCKQNKIGIVKQSEKSSVFPFYYLLFRSNGSYYAIPNNELEGKEDSVTGLNYIVISLLQFKDKINNENNLDMQKKESVE